MGLLHIDLRELVGSILQGTCGPPGGSPDVHNQCRVFMQSAGQSREKDLRDPGSSGQQWRERPSFAWVMTEGGGGIVLLSYRKESICKFFILSFNFPRKVLF